MNFNSRDEIGLVPPSRSIPDISPDGTAGHWNGPGIWIARWGAILDHSVCLSLWRGIQSFHMNARGWSDIAYGAGACPHGYVLEGRGVGKRTAANGTNHANTVASAVCALVGEDDPVTSEMIQAMLDAQVWLSGYGSERSGHRDWFSTVCPGDEIYPLYVNGTVPGGPTPTPTPEPQPQPTPPSGVVGRLVWHTPHRRTRSRSPYPAEVKFIQNVCSVDTDAWFGSDTAEAVIGWQAERGLVVDGVVGDVTGLAMVQAHLNHMGYDCGTVDGISGRNTGAGIIAFQRAVGVDVDGIFGSVSTVAALQQIGVDPS